MPVVCNNPLTFPGECNLVNRAPGGKAIAQFFDGVANAAGRNTLLDQAFGLAQEYQVLEGKVQLTVLIADRGDHT